MLYHASIDAYDPERVARVIAELWRGNSSPFYAGHIAWAGDERGTQIEVYPIGAVNGLEADETAEFDRSKRTATHLAVGTPLTEDEVLAIARRENWPARKLERQGMFSVIELWIEGRQMIELLTEEEQARYRKLWQNPAIGDLLRRTSQGLPMKSTGEP